MLATSPKATTCYEVSIIRNYSKDFTLQLKFVVTSILSLLWKSICLIHWKATKIKAQPPLVQCLEIPFKLANICGHWLCTVRQVSHSFYPARNAEVLVNKITVTHQPFQFRSTRPEKPHLLQHCLWGQPPLCGWVCYSVEGKPHLVNFIDGLCTNCQRSLTTSLFQRDLDTLCSRNSFTKTFYCSVLNHLGQSLCSSHTEIMINKR